MSKKPNLQQRLAIYKQALENIGRENMYICAELYSNYRAMFQKTTPDDILSWFPEVKLCLPKELSSGNSLFGVRCRRWFDEDERRYYHGFSGRGYSARLEDKRQSDLRVSILQFAICLTREKIRKSKNKRV